MSAATTGGAGGALHPLAEFQRAPKGPLLLEDI